MKVTVVGAGAVGASSAEYIAIKNFASEVVLVDIKENLAEGKAMDLMQTATLNGFDTKITGSTNDYLKTANSDVAVITSGIPRKPGMTREELIGINAEMLEGKDRRKIFLKLSDLCKNPKLNQIYEEKKLNFLLNKIQVFKERANLKRVLIKI